MYVFCQEPLTFETLPFSLPLLVSQKEFKLMYVLFIPMSFINLNLIVFTVEVGPLHSGMKGVNNC